MALKNVSLSILLNNAKIRSFTVMKLYSEEKQRVWLDNLLLVSRKEQKVSFQPQRRLSEEIR